MISVIKLGGSLADGSALRLWLDTIRRHAGQLVVVPGGGSFADEVRATQRKHGFSDRAAHRMALLAMEQYAVMLSDLEPALIPFSGLEEIGAIMARRRVPVWLPTRLASAAPDIEESWDVTSDSLAAWLARRTGARQLMLVKSLAQAPDAATPESWAEQGVVDRAFPAMLFDSEVKATCLGINDQDRVAQILRMR